MHVETAGATAFTVDFTKYELVGFHATSAIAEQSIELLGFLPHKFFARDTHIFLLDLAQQLGIETGN